MNSEIKAKWVEALRSGNYKQGKNTLREGDNFCCLGVLCDIYSKKNKENWEYRESQFLDREIYTMFDVEDILPTEVAKWAGFPVIEEIRGIDPQIMAGNIDSTGEKIPSSLSHINDAGRPFSCIADLIEAQL